MKSSTKSASSNRPALKGIRGLIFFDPTHKPLHVTVESWERAGKPEHCFVYDGAHQLLSAGIPIADAIEVEGRWVRCHLGAVCPDTHYRKHARLAKKRVKTSTIPLVDCEFMTSADANKRKLR